MKKLLELHDYADARSSLSNLLKSCLNLAVRYVPNKTHHLPETDCGGADNEACAGVCT